MLIDSPRLTAADRAHWDRLSRYDALLAKDPQLQQYQQQAIDIITHYAGQGPCYASTSWGKDSTVLCHLVALSGLPIPIRFARCQDWETPEVADVRDAFLARYPHVDYHEHTYSFPVPLRGEPGHDQAPAYDALAVVFTNYGRRITGVRAEESRTRRMTHAVHGHSSATTCRPIGHWQATHVFAYLQKHDLPIHPAYAMTAAGAYDRRTLRVHPLGTAMPNASTRSRHEEWEDTYYADVMAHARDNRAHLWQPTPDRTPS